MQYVPLILIHSQHKAQDICFFEYNQNDCNRTGSVEVGLCMSEEDCDFSGLFNAAIRGWVSVQTQ